MSPIEQLRQLNPDHHWFLSHHMEAYRTGTLKNYWELTEMTQFGSRIRHIERPTLEECLNAAFIAYGQPFEATILL